MRLNCKLPLLCLIVCFLMVSIVTLLSGESQMLPPPTVQSGNFHWPMVGFGTAALGSLPRESIETALDLGYRLFDSASDTGPWYKTESVIGSLLKQRHATLKREEFFLITKLHPQDHGTKHAEASIQKSLMNLETAYIDLFLLHYPACWGDLCHERPEGDWKQSWRVMEQYYHRGILKHLGVSNFREDELRELWSFAEVKPFLVQNHFEFGNLPKNVLEFCRKHGIQFMSYSSLHLAPSLSAAVSKIGERHGKSEKQVLLKWQLQHNISVIPRSTNPLHIKENFDLFDWELSADEITEIALLKEH